MADIIARFKGDTSDLDGKIGKASKGLMQMKADCEKVGGAFINLEKKDLDFIKSLGKLETGAKSAKGTMSELTKAFTDMSAVYNRLTEEEKKDEGGKALRTSLDQLKERIKDGSKELKKISGEISNNGSLLDQLSGKFGVNIKQLASWGGAIGAGKIALDVMKDAFLSNEQGVDDWGRTVEGAESLYRSFCAALNNMSLQGYFNTMDEIFNHAKKVYDAMDNLKTHGGIISNNEARLNAQRAQYQKILKDPNATEAQKAAARTGLKNVQSQKAAAVDETKALNNDYIKAYLKQKFVTEGGLTEAEYKKYYGDIVKSLYDTSAADALNNQWVSRTSKRHGVSSTSGLATSTTQNYRLNVGAMLKDSDREALNPYIQAYWNADARKYQDERADNRILGSGSGGKGGKGGSTTSKETYAEGELGYIRQQISELQKELQHSTSAAMSDAINKKIAELQGEAYILEGKLKVNIDTTDTVGEELRKGLGGEPMDLMATLKADTEGLASVLKQGNPDSIYSVADNYAMQKTREKYKPSEDKKGRGSMENVMQTLDKSVGALNSINSGLKELGFDFGEGFDRSLSVMNSLLSVFNGVQTIMSLIQTLNAINEPSQTAFLGTIATNTGLAAAGSWMPWHTGGLVHAATGIFVPGSPNGGIDTVPSLLTPGELVLNAAQQQNLANILTEGSQQQSPMQPYITSEMIYLGLSNYLMRKGKGEIVTTH